MTHKINTAGKITFADKCPELLSEWDYDRNDKGPEDYSFGCNDKVFWICPEGHSYSATIKCRSQGSQCPYCASKKILVGFNDLSSTNPELASQWDFDKNILKPTEVTAGSNKKVFWICPEGHSYPATVKNRSRGKDCPFCAGKKVIEGFNDLAHTNPELAAQWSKKNKIRPTEVSAGSQRKVFWKCPFGHEWKASVKSRSNGSGCAVCSQGARTSLPEKITYFYIKKYFPSAKANYKPDWLKGKETDIYIPELKLCIEYDGYRWHWETEDKDKEKDMLIGKADHRIVRIREDGLPDLNDNSITVALSKDVSLDQAIEILIEHINHIYNLDIKSEIDSDRDYNKIVNILQCSIKEHSLMETHPDLCKEWDKKHNGNLKPEFITAGSKRKVSWKCKQCGETYIRTVFDRTHRNAGCPYCRNIKSISKIKYENVRCA